MILCTPVTVIKVLSCSGYLLCGTLIILYYYYTQQASVDPCTLEHNIWHYRCCTPVPAADGNGDGNSKCRFVERINARNLSTAATPLMRYVSQLRRKHTSLYAVLKLSIFKTMNACYGVVERPADDSWLIAGNVYCCHL